MNTELIITLALLAAELGILRWCYVRSKRPPDPLRPRILPYGLITVFLSLAILVTMAHTYSVLSGHRLEARNKMKGQH
jgi:hypothetical protein